MQFTCFTSTKVQILIPEERVQEFVLINYVILAKVLKSHAKRCGTGANAELAQRLNFQLRSTYLFASAGLLDLTHKAEALVAGDVSVGKARVMEGDAWIESRYAVYLPYYYKSTNSDT